MPLFTRTPTPILTPQTVPAWGSGAVFNPGASYDGSGVHLLFRAIPAGYQRIQLGDPDPTGPSLGYDNYISCIGYAHSRDGVRFQVRETPFISPDAPFDRFGAEDPRISKIDDHYLITYTALSQPAFGAEDGVRIGLASTPDFEHLRKHGVIGPDVRNKDAVLFPRRIGGRIAMLHRVVPDVQIVTFRNLDELFNPPAQLWSDHLATLEDHVVMRPERTWEAKKIGAGPTPIETEDGWLLIYHGVDAHHVYRTGLALLDAEDPTRVLARTSRPVFEPETDFELFGDVDNVVFPEGAVVIDGVLHLYYGGADKVIGHATAPLSDALALLHEERVSHGPSPRIYLDGGDVATIETQPGVRLERMHAGQPVLEPIPDHPWEARVVFNPAAVLVEDDELGPLCEAWDLGATARRRLSKAGGACVMVYRAQGEADATTGVARSSLGLAVFTPQLELVHRWPEPVLRPEASFHHLGLEDPRCTKVGDTWHLFYTGYHADAATGVGHVHICLATTRTFVDWKLCGPVEGDVNEVDNKNAVLLPEPVEGRWLLLHRPMQGHRPMAIHWAEAGTPEGPWRSRGLLMAGRRYQEFALSWIGAGGPPIPLGNQRFIAVYHQGHYTYERQREYDLAAALLDFGAAHPVQSRIEPLLRPEGELERCGDPDFGVDNVVFSCANYVHEDQLVIPYAGADSRIFGASVPLSALRDALHAATP